MAYIGLSRELECLEVQLEKAVTYGEEYLDQIETLKNEIEEIKREINEELCRTKELTYNNHDREDDYER